ncbi:MAG TPA: SH3 domain-containing protein [Novosphingobium sp.]|nr:SH3 domain-containing protein [Novosphingobium sp.]
MTRLSAPLFDFGMPQPLASEHSIGDSHVRKAAQPRAVELAMTGPSVRFEPGHLPVRGDLAHIKLAGRYFVPHYAVPMHHRVAAAQTVLRKAGRSEAEAVSTLDRGSHFDVLDIAGGWAWGQVASDNTDEEGFVGYIAISDLEKVEQ